MRKASPEQGRKRRSNIQNLVGENPPPGRIRTVSYCPRAVSPVHHPNLFRPCYFQIGAPLDEDPTADEFSMVGLEEIIARHGYFPVGGSLPPEARIGCIIPPHRLGGQTAHISIGLIEL